MMKLRWILPVLLLSFLIGCSNPFVSSFLNEDDNNSSSENANANQRLFGSLAVNLDQTESEGETLGAQSLSAAAEDVAVYYVSLYPAGSDERFDEEKRLEADNGTPPRSAVFERVPAGIWTVGVRGEDEQGNTVLEGSRSNVEVEADAVVSVALVLFRIGSENAAPAKEATDQPQADPPNVHAPDADAPVETVVDAPVETVVEPAVLQLSPNGHHGDRFVALAPESGVILRMDGSGERRVFFGEPQSDSTVQLRGVRLGEDSPGWGLFFHGEHNEKGEYTGYSMQFDYGLSPRTGGVFVIRRWVAGRAGGRELAPLVRVGVDQFPGLVLHETMDVTMSITASTITVVVEQNGQSHTVLDLHGLQEQANLQALANDVDYGTPRDSGILGIRTWTESSLEISEVGLLLN